MSSNLSRRVSLAFSLLLIAAGMGNSSSANAAGIPSQITITKASTAGTTVALAWKQNNAPKVRMYKVEIKNLTNPKAPLILLNTPVTNINYSKLVLNNNYEVRIRLTFGKFFYNWSPKKVFSTSLRAPSGLSSLDVTDNSVRLSWDSVVGADSYKIYLDGKFAGGTTQSNFSLENLSSGTSYKAAVTSLSNSVESVLSPSISVSTKTPIVTITSAVTSETITSTTLSEISSTSARISWVTPVGAKSFTVQVFDALGINVLNTYQVSGELRTLSITGLAPLSTYVTSITRNNADGSLWTTPVTTFTTLRNPVLGLVLTPVSTTSVNLSWIPVAGAASYDLFRDGASIATGISAATTSYVASGLTPGYNYNFVLRVASLDSNRNLVYSDSSIGVTGAPFADAQFAPSINSAPVVTLPYANAPIVGATLSAASGIWSNATQISFYGYQWQRSLDGGGAWVDLSGQTSSNYTVVASDYQYRLRVAVTARNNNGIFTAFSSASAMVDALYSVQIPVIRGQLIPGQVLEVNEGTWSSKYPMTYTYQWFSNNSAIAGEQSTTYTLKTSDIGDQITAKVTAITSLGSLTVTSALRSAVTAIANTELPVVSGVTKAYSTLSTTVGTWIGSPTGTTYQWQRSNDLTIWDSIAGATSSSYTLALGDVGYYLRSQVFETKTVTSVTYKVVASSLPTSMITALNITNIGLPLISGAWTSGQLLTVSAGSWSTVGSISYQWQSSANGSSWGDIAGATAATFTITNTEAGLYLRAKIQNVSAGATGIAYSNATPKVGAPHNSVLPTISGNRQVGETQTVLAGTWSASPALTYQWQSSTDGIVWSAIAGATESTTVMTFALSNTRIRAVVTASNAVDTATATTISISGFAPPRVSVVPVISGTSTVGQTLSSTTGTWPNTSSGYEYQWQRSLDGGQSWISIANAVANTYSLVSADAGYIVRVQVSLTNTSGTSTSYSLPTIVVVP